MAQTVKIERTHRNFAVETNRYDVKRERLVRAARKLAEMGQATKVSITQITTAVGITRGLFYYYFASKDELNKAVVETYTEDLMGMIQASCEENTEQEHVVQAVVRCVRSWLFEETGELTPMWHVLQDLDMIDAVRQRTSEELASFFIRAGLLAKHERDDDEMLFCHARFVAVAILGECRLRPDAPIRTISEAACAALRYRRHQMPVVATV